jgi:hypothetical protein
MSERGGVHGSLLSRSEVKGARLDVQSLSKDDANGLKTRENSTSNYEKTVRREHKNHPPEIAVDLREKEEGQTTAYAVRVLLIPPLQKRTIFTG